MRMNGFGMAAIAALAIGVGLPAQAAEGPQPGCYAREYSPAHLKANPAQIVEAIALEISLSPDQSSVWAALSARFADQGRVKGGPSAGETMTQSLNCFDSDGRLGCAVDCDGGFFQVLSQDAKALTFRTEWLWVGDTEGCGGAEDLAEVKGQPTLYKLFKVDDATCAALFPPEP